MPSWPALSTANDTDIIDIDDRYPNFDIYVFRMFDQKLVMSYPREQWIADRCKSQIRDFYWDVFKRTKCIPKFDEIYDAVLGWNYGVCYEAATIEKSMSPDCAYKTLDDLCDEWQDVIELDFIAGMDRYVYEALNSYGLTFTASYDETYFWQEDMMRVRMENIDGFMINDAQCLLMPEFVKHRQVGYGDWVNIYPELNGSLLLLEGGKT